jgi:AbrB family looped-hinge helix DNA binding protein
MKIVTVSSRFQLTIPKEVRRDGKIQPGDKMFALMKHGLLSFVPIRRLSETRGILPGLTTRGLRDERDRL